MTNSQQRQSWYTRTWRVEIGGGECVYMITVYVNSQRLRSCVRDTVVKTRTLGCLLEENAVSCFYFSNLVSLYSFTSLMRTSFTNFKKEDPLPETALY